MKTIVIFLILLLVLAELLGCGKQQQPRHIVILPDVSGSIERESLEQAFKAIDELASQLHRGDRIAIIPILGDAQAEASGRIIRFEVPRERRAYDADLRDFRRRLSTSLAEMRNNAVAHPGSKTDILGSVELAAQEFQSEPWSLDKRFVLLSDFIQEDGHLDFRKDNQLNGQSVAKNSAIHLAKINKLNLSGITIYLGLLRSSEYVSLNRERRAAIGQFWLEYFRACGGHPKVADDGPGLIESSMVAELRTHH